MEDTVNVSSETILDKKNKTTDIITVCELLSGDHVFRIPDYQRGYAWHDEFDALWKDILRLHRAGVQNRKHYTGMLALEEMSETEKGNEYVLGTNAFYIVDGQQRITSLIIIVKYLIEYIAEEDDTFCKDDYLRLLNTEEGTDKFGYSVARSDGLQDYFSQRVLQGACQESHSDQYRANIHHACGVLETALRKFDAETAKKLLDLVLNKIVFNIYFVTDSFDVRVTFETINNRGKKLSNLELLKNRLMYLSTFLTENDSRKLKGAINAAWTTIYDSLSYGDSQMSDDEYLKAHWIVYKRLDKRNGNAYIEDILNKDFSVDQGDFYSLIGEKEYKKAYDYLCCYIESLKKYSKYWAYVKHQQSNRITVQPQEEAWMKRFGRLTGNLYVRAALMVVLAENGLSLPSKEDFYSSLERFLFVNTLLTRDIKDLSFIVTCARDLLNAPTGKKVEAFKAMKKQIEDHDLVVTAARVQAALQAWKLYIESHEIYYYKWSGLQYFLYEYNESLNIPNAAPIEWYDLSKVSVEHVFPQTPDRDYWKLAFDGYIDTEQQARITNALGNLLLLSSGSENSSLKNYSYPVKRNMSVSSGKFGYTDGSRSARAIAENEHWTPKQVYERTKKMFEFMYAHWFLGLSGLTKTDWDEMVEQLGLYNFDYTPLTDAEQTKLEEQLAGVDTAQERKSAEQALVDRKATEYDKNTILSYFDRGEIDIRYNQDKIFYREWFAFLLERDNNGNLSLFHCRVKESGKRVEFGYSYKTNEFCVYNHDGFYYAEDEITNPKWMLFIRSFFRYVRKEFGKKPNWKQEWV